MRKVAKVNSLLLSNALLITSAGPINVLVLEINMLLILTILEFCVKYMLVLLYKRIICSECTLLYVLRIQSLAFA